MYYIGKNITATCCMLSKNKIQLVSYMIIQEICHIVLECVLNYRFCTSMGSLPFHSSWLLFWVFCWSALASSSITSYVEKRQFLQQKLM